MSENKSKQYFCTKKFIFVCNMIKGLFIQKFFENINLENFEIILNLNKTKISKFISNKKFIKSSFLFILSMSALVSKAKTSMTKKFKI